MFTTALFFLKFISNILKLVDKFIHIQRETRNPIDLIFVELILKSLLYLCLYQGPRIWNSLPMHIKTASSFQSFKQLMKLFLRNKQDHATHI